jgi:glycine oxidase
MQSSPLIIIGGGVIGLATAYELAKRNKQVMVLEKGECGGQATGAAAGMLAPYSEIGEDPDDFFTMCHRSLLMYPEWQEELKKISKKDFEYNTNGSLHVVFHEADDLALETRLSWQQRWQVDSEIVRGKRLGKIEPNLSNDVISAMYYPGEHHIYSPDYVTALKVACTRLGVQLIEGTGEVTFSEILKDGVALATENKGAFTADECIVSNGAWTSFFEQDLDVRLPVFPIRGQICAYKQGAEKVHHMIFSSQGYVVSKGNGSIVCGASEDIAGYDTSVTEKGIGRLIKWSGRLFPFMESKEPFHRWAGLRPATQDGYPLIGRLPHYPNIIISSGHYRNGILLSPINANLVADIIEDKETNISIEAFNPMRFS